MRAWHIRTPLLLLLSALCREVCLLGGARGYTRTRDQNVKGGASDRSDRSVLASAVDGSGLFLFTKKVEVQAEPDAYLVGDDSLVPPVLGTS